MKLLCVIIELKESITQSELENAGYDSELDYWKDYVRLNPNLLSRDSEITLIEE